jgi:hypothetical protein
MLSCPSVYVRLVTTMVLRGTATLHSQGTSVTFTWIMIVSDARSEKPDLRRIN